MVRDILKPDWSKPVSKSYSQTSPRVGLNTSSFNHVCLPSPNERRGRGFDPRRKLFYTWSILIFGGFYFNQTRVSRRSSWSLPKSHSGTPTLVPTSESLIENQSSSLGARTHDLSVQISEIFSFSPFCQHFFVNSGIEPAISLFAKWERYKSSLFLQHFPQKGPVSGSNHDLISLVHEEDI